MYVFIDEYVVSRAGCGGASALFPAAGRLRGASSWTDSSQIQGRSAQIYLPRRPTRSRCRCSILSPAWRSPISYALFPWLGEGHPSLACCSPWGSAYSLMSPSSSPTRSSSALSSGPPNLRMRSHSWNRASPASLSKFRCLSPRRLWLAPMGTDSKVGIEEISSWARSFLQFSVHQVVKWTF